jgi:prolyl-tRNA editing enzyme YbaK/EbsC (Cys-tRNA(Pro) deacylase)
MATSTERVIAAAATAGLAIEVITMPASTRTAEEAAAACGCAVGQIVKSLVFQGHTSGKLYLLLVSGSNMVDMDKAAAHAGEKLDRADPRMVRERTGFAIGGVAPIGHMETCPALMDQDLLQYETVWAAAGAPNAVFSVDPAKLQTATNARATELRRA